MTGFFAVVFAVIANLAWATGAGTSGPWFSSTVTLETYSVSLLGASVLAILVAAVASVRVASLDEALRAIDLRVAVAKDAESREANVAGEVGAAAQGPPEDQEIDELLEAIGGFEPAPVVKVERTGHDSLIASPAPPATAKAGAETLREIRRQRLRLRSARTNVWRVVVGPLLASTAFIAVSGAMLPGALGFAESHYQLNTALILLLGYGWAPLVAWAVTAVLMTNAAPPKTSE